MEPIILFFSLGITNVIILLVLTMIIVRSKTSKTSKFPNIPPGKYGWPILGETLSYVSAPAKFIRDRMTMHNPEVFKTSIAGEKILFFCGPKANKFLFSNEGSLVNMWMPRCIVLALSTPVLNSDDSPSGKPTGELSFKFLRVDNIKKFVPMVHTMVQEHLNAYWFPNKEVKVYPLAKEFAFALSCKILINASIDQVIDIAKPFNQLIEGILSVPVNFPGTPYYKAVKGGKLVREKLIEIMKQRRKQVSCKVDFDGDNSQLDLLTRLIIDNDQNNKGYSDEYFASKIIGFMFAGFYPTSTTVTFLISNLAEHPLVYERVLQEQLQIAESKKPGEPLTWNDVQKMKYSWNVICETMRLASPVPGSFREVKTDFNYAGFLMPKGWKIHWALHTTHTDPRYFPDPEKFDPTRFEGNGPAPYTYVPFGAGPRMCPGKEFVRVQILVFLHNVVTKYKFIRVNPNEKIIYNPDPVATEGLRIFLQPREC